MTETKDEIIARLQARVKAQRSEKEASDREEAIRKRDTEKRLKKLKASWDGVFSLVSSSVQKTNADLKGTTIEIAFERSVRPESDTVFKSYVLRFSSTPVINHRISVLIEVDMDGNVDLFFGDNENKLAEEETSLSSFNSDRIERTITRMLSFASPK